jgi:hypothetical protein
MKPGKQKRSGVKTHCVMGHARLVPVGRAEPDWKLESVTILALDDLFKKINDERDAKINQLNQGFCDENK